MCNSKLQVSTVLNYKLNLIVNQKLQSMIYCKLQVKIILSNPNFQDRHSTDHGTWDVRQHPDANEPSNQKLKNSSSNSTCSR
jgi:hypothetical protein